MNNKFESITRDLAKETLNKEVVLDSAYIDGNWEVIESSSISHNGIDKHALYDPSTGDVIATTRLCTKAHVDAAANAASQAILSWSQTTVSERASYLNAIADAMEQKFNQLVGLSVLNNGKPIAEAKMDADDAIACYRYYANLIAAQTTWTEVSTDESSVRLLKTFAPVGICALIVPWNFPMVTTSWKLAAALAAGCTVILKPSEVTLLPELLLGNILSAIGLPKGVVNILPGAAEVGAAMTSHPLIDKVSFTGSNGVGEKVMAQAAKDVKDISLELGGKSAIVIRADADLDMACDIISGGIFTNAGQMCSATSRLLVHHDIADALYQKLKEYTQNIHISAGFDPNTQMGPLVSQQQLNQVHKYFNIATEEKLDCLIGGQILDRSGYFASPTIYTNVPMDSCLWTEEIFGPVLVSRTFKDDAEAIQLANNSKFGLAATVVSADEKAALEMVLQIKAGHLWINEQQILFAQAGWGGFKQSGIGRELGEDGLSAYQKSKHVILPSQ
ncbi:aldehyde dehydrogenase family protein [Psychrobacter frigidicola]|uniref:aldehyde dehydrogenase family protein n=1 Tax=Psychrobacter frigidicola TaxID=45611 RepID=UPI00191B35BE|nr:aldehyde dehydrogenase family protein [Psychrobacter frigidicola]